MRHQDSSAVRQDPLTERPALVVIVELLGEILAELKPTASEQYALDPDKVNAAVRSTIRTGPSPDLRSRTARREFDRAAAEPLMAPRARLIAERDAARVELAETQAELRAAEGEVRRLAVELGAARQGLWGVDRSTVRVGADDGDLVVTLVSGPMLVVRVEVIRIERMSDRADVEVWVQVCGHDFGSGPTQRTYAWGPGQTLPLPVRQFLASKAAPADAVEPRRAEAEQ